jgi:iron complex transport system substrate-binding protein
LRIYYARSADGLATATSSSTLADVIRYVGAANVADATGKSDGLVHVTREQIGGWNPDTLVTNNPDFWKGRQSPEWAALPAIATGRVYLAPAHPWGWIDEPPSVNRLLGPLWAAHALYGIGSDQDLQAAAVRFYRQFYRTDLSPKQFEELMQ